MNQVVTMAKWLVGVVAVAVMVGCVSVLPSEEPLPAYQPQVEPVSLDILRTSPSAVNPPQATANGTNDVETSFFSSSRVLKSGDRVQVTIYAPPEPFTSPHVIDEQGRINLPLIGAMAVAGKTCADAQRLIERKYIDDQYYKVITVVIVPPESEYSLAGEVLRPGPYPITRNLTVTQALGRGGRFTDYADPTKIRLIRGSEILVINTEDIRKGKIKDVMVVPGDVIEVPRRWY
jgi:polysaccharide export outer membrane protein